jgi:hypothetical protein
MIITVCSLYSGGWIGNHFKIIQSPDLWKRLVSVFYDTNLFCDFINQPIPLSSAPKMPVQIIFESATVKHIF